MRPLKLAYSKIIPFKGFYAITIFNYLIRRDKYKNTPIEPITYNHESIHQAQAYDFGIGFCGYFIFYILYFLEWLFKAILSIFTGFKVKAYYSISFEQECFEHQQDLQYLNNRKSFSWVKYIFKTIKR